MTTLMPSRIYTTPRRHIATASEWSITVPMRQSCRPRIDYRRRLPSSRLIVQARAHLYHVTSVRRMVAQPSWLTACCHSTVGYRLYRIFHDRFHASPAAALLMSCVISRMQPVPYSLFGHSAVSNPLDLFIAFRSPLDSIGMNEREWHFV